MVENNISYERNSLVTLENKVKELLHSRFEHYNRRINVGTKYFNEVDIVNYGGIYGFTYADNIDKVDFIDREHTLYILRKRKTSLKKVLRELKSNNVELHAPEDFGNRYNHRVITVPTDMSADEFNNRYPIVKVDDLNIIGYMESKNLI